MRAQCGLYSAPCFIHFSISFISCSESERFDDGGGICSDVSAEEMRRNICECRGSPAIIANDPGCSFNAANALSAISRRRLACLCFESGPWHLKQRSESMGRI